MIFETQRFEVEFDGVQFLKFSHCDNSVCGLCGMDGSKAVAEYLTDDGESCME